MGKRERENQKNKNGGLKKKLEKKAGGNTTKKNGNLKQRSQKLKAKMLKTYYGNPMRDMKLVAITGTTGKTIVAHYVHEILRAAGEKVAVLASEHPFKLGMLHKFLSDAWKAGANYVVVTVPNESLEKNVFYGLPVYIAAMTDFVTANLKDMTPEEFLRNEKTLFDMKPDYIVLNKDDLNYEKFADFEAKEGMVDYGKTSSDVKILNSKLYSRGTEATLLISPDVVSVATFLSGETTVPYMACAAAIATVLGAKNEHIIEGIAEYSLE